MAARKEKILNTSYNDIIVHFKHPHPLEISTIQRLARRYDQCGLCSEYLDAVARVYSCKNCPFFLHEHCAELKLYITHPFHPHALVCQTGIFPTMELCGVCSSAGSHYSWYRCEEAGCKFNMHLKCAILKPVDSFAIDGHQVDVIQNSHGHSLLVCNKPNALRFSCTRCGDEFGDDDMIYICLECKSVLDEPCAAHGMEIRHSLHPQHTLSLVKYFDRLPRCCSFCGGGGRTIYFYKCSSCAFRLDVDCSNLDVTARISKTNQGQIQIQPVTHSHPLIQVDVMINMKKFKSSCFACGLRFEDLVYACLSCGILLHKSCADLPNEITSHLHPNHPLKLVESYSRSNERSSYCRVCIQSSTGHFFYNCRQCEFGLDVKCARAAFPLIMSEFHEHALAYIDIQTDNFGCAMCSGICRQYCFRCLHLHCNFSIHDYCYPSLPPSIKHDCHIHPLTFTPYPIKEVQDDLEEGTELYCYACEEPRAFQHPTYFCSSCQFVAHLHCVINAIIPYLQKELPRKFAISRIGFGEEARTTGINLGDVEASLRQLDNEIMRVQWEIHALHDKMAELMNRRKFLQERRDQFYKSQGGLSMGEDLSGLSPFGPSLPFFNLSEPDLNWDDFTLVLENTAQSELGRIRPKPN